MTDAGSLHAGAERRNIVIFGALIVASMLMWWHPLISTLRLAQESDAATHALLIVPLSVALVFVERKRAPRVMRPSGAIGIALLGAGLALAGAAKWAVNLPGDIRLSLSVLGLVIWWIGSICLCFGAKTFRAFLFPIALLFLIVPIPDFAVNGITDFLQQGSAASAYVMFRAVGVPASQDGTFISIPNLDIEVAPQCSSIRSSLLLVIVTMVLAYLFLRAQWRRVFLVACAIPLSFIKNGLRIFVIAELGTQVDPGYLDGRLHHRGGIIFLGVAVVVVIGLLWILRRGEVQESRELVPLTNRE